MKKKIFFTVLLFSNCFFHADLVTAASSTQKAVAHKDNVSRAKEAFINVPMIFDQSTMGRDLHAEMVGEARKFQDELEAKGKDIERAKKDLSNKAAAMSPEAVRQEEKKIALQERELSVQIKEKEEDFQMMAAKKEQAWAQEFQNVVAEWAREEHFEKVWDEVTGRPLYVDDKLKHTDEVIACMNKRNADKKNVSVSAEKAKSSVVKKV